MYRKVIKTLSKILFEEGSNKGMKRIWLLGIMALLMIALLATAASASLISLDANITSITLTKGTTNFALTNATNSSVAVSGNDYYLSPSLTDSESYSPSVTVSTNPSVNDSYGVSLQKMAGSISGTALSASLVAKGPYGSPSNPGYISETVTDTANYTTHLTGSGQTSISIPYNVTYSSDNNSGYRFYSVTYTITATVIQDNISLHTYTLLDKTIVNGDKSPLANIAPFEVSGTMTGAYDMSNGANKPFSVVLTATETGYTYTVPLPPSAFLLGTGLLGLGAVGWGRKHG
jgi:hypothetical protein